MSRTLLRWSITLTILFFFAVPLGIIAFAALGGVVGAAVILLALGCLQYPLLRFVSRRLEEAK